MYKLILNLYKKDFINNENGFTLLETIISIATLSMISVFILQMFIVSSTANEKARNIDIAASYATSAIETLKSAKTVESIENNHFFNDTITFDNETVDIVYYKWFDKDWNVLIPAEPTLPENIYFKDGLKLDIEDFPMNAAYVLIIDCDIEADEETVTNISFNTADKSNNIEKTSGKIVDFNVKAVDLQALLNNNELVNFTTKKYFNIQK